MIWTALYMFLAWGTARLIKSIFIKSDLKKITAIFFAVIWSLIWVIGAAIVFEYIFGAGTFNKKMLFLSIFSTAVISYYALTAKASKANSKKNVQSPISPEAVVIPALQTNKINSSTNNIFQKLFLAKTGTRALVSLIAAILLFTLILATEAFLVRAEWLTEYQKFEASQVSAKTPICYKLSNNIDLTNEELMLVPKVNVLSLLIDSTGKIVNCKEEDKYCGAFKFMVLSEIGCLITENPGSLAMYWISHINPTNFIPLCLLVGLIIFCILLTGRELIFEKSIGWKRLSIVLGGLFSIMSIVYILVTKDDFRNDEFVILILISLILIPMATITLMLKGKFIFEWVKQGFTEK